MFMFIYSNCTSGDARPFIRHKPYKNTRRNTRTLSYRSHVCSHSPSNHSRRRLYGSTGHMNSANIIAFELTFYIIPVPNKTNTWFIVIENRSRWPFVGIFVSFVQSSDWQSSGVLACIVWEWTFKNSTIQKIVKNLIFLFCKLEKLLIKIT